MLAYIFQKETGEDIEKYGEKYLFTPLGMDHYWKRSPMGVVVELDLGCIRKSNVVVKSRILTRLSAKRLPDC